MDDPMGKVPGMHFLISTPAVAVQTFAKLSSGFKVQLNLICQAICQASTSFAA